MDSTIVGSDNGTAEEEVKRYQLIEFGLFF